MLSNLRKGQRIDVRAVRDIVRLDTAGTPKGTIKAGSVCQLYRYFDDLSLGRDRDGNFTTYLRSAVEGVDFELIAGRLPFPD